MACLQTCRQQASAADGFLLCNCCARPFIKLPQPHRSRRPSLLPARLQAPQQQQPQYYAPPPTYAAGAPPAGAYYQPPPYPHPQQQAAGGYAATGHPYYQQAPPAYGYPAPQQPAVPPYPPGAAAGGVPAAGAAAPPNFDAMSVSELKAYLRAHGATDLSGAVEKSDLVAIAKAMQ